MFLVMLGGGDGYSMEWLSDSRHILYPDSSVDCLIVVLGFI
jgi:hypothetical protein